MHAPNPTMNRRAIPVDALESMWAAPGGWPIRRIDWQGATPARGSMLFLPGRGDHYEKYLETLVYFAAKGWRVTSIDWRGQGASGRLLKEPQVGHIDDFSTWISDLEHFWGIWKAETPGPHIVLAHSMGGHLPMRALVEKVIDPVAVAMSAPMLGIQTGGLPLSLNHAFARLMLTIGRGDVAAWKVSEKPLSPMNLRAKILTADKDRYEDELAWWELRPEVKLGPPSWHWVERAIASIRMLDEPGKLEAVQTPILLIATTADQLVSTPRIIKDSKRLPNAETLIFGKEAAHELLREVDAVRDKCLERIDSFMDKHAQVA
ncbi:MAG TPA: alpha/beta hydrolase [Sphingorhabdus sp.]|nr:alpha/beta hydrolase [Sphingorhabdus sp.]